MAETVNAKIQMYRLNELGDCFLLTFASGDDRSRVLIDCGSFRNGAASKARLEAVVAAIKDDLAGASLDVVVGTHQHNDHVSGFVHCEPAFRELGIGQVWLSWLDDPRDPKARVIARQHNNLKLQLAAARDTLHAATRNARAARPTAARTLDVLNDVLGFFGAKEAGTPPELPANAIAILKQLGKKKPLYLKPGRTIEVPGLPPGVVRVHVLGPPRDSELLYRKDPRTGESYDHALAAAGLMATKFLDAARGEQNQSRDEQHFPFNTQYKNADPAAGSAHLKAMVNRYRDEAWRTIDDDWMQLGGALALYLDTFTNNSSLVLAFELVASGKVLLFVADAQTGNWVSWKDVKWQRADVSTVDLLERTVFYKVGHHASHNATLVELFEQVSHPDLVALIPVHKKDSNITKPNGWKMPARNLFKRLVDKTDHRVLQMDNDNPADCNPARNPAKASWQRVGIKPRITDMSIEIDIAG
jgi:glyoxylase-like metal-dependent hydrolase (beta-lactamase superfamily II)